MSPWLRACLFSLAFIAVDWLSFIHPIGHLNITPWNPPAALEVLFLFWAGRKGWLWVYLTLCLSDLLVRQAVLVSGAVLVGNAVLVSCYAAIATVFRLLLSQGAGMRERNALLRLGLTMVGGAGFTACAYVGAQTLLGVLPSHSIWEAVHRFFIGDLLGFFIVLPLTFLLNDSNRRGQFLDMFSHRLFWVLMIMLLACLWWVFATPIESQMKYFFSLFIVLGLLAATFSLPGATLASALIQLPLVLASSQAGVTPEMLMDMQIVMLSLSLTGLIIGMVVDERIMAEQQLRDSLQLIAAGELAGALAHELHQPMSAVSAYSESAMIMLDESQNNPNALPRVRQTLSKVVSETLRARDIVSGLRSYFIGGTSHPQHAALLPLIDDCIERVANLNHRSGITIERFQNAPDRMVFVDTVQVKTALGNLLKNAIEASSPGMTVSVQVCDQGPQQVSIRVVDEGVGLQEEVVNQMFKPFYTLKKDGLGLGLSVSKSLVEVNGGTLSYRHHPLKCFEIVLPIERSLT